jgi:Histidine kinase
MNASSQNWFSKHIARIFGWRRVRVVLPVCVLFMILFSFTWEAGYRVLIGRLLFFGLAGLFAFGLFEQWPRRLPTWLARWALQVAAVAVAMPIAVWIGYSVTNWGLNPPWWRDQGRLLGFGTFTFLGLLLAPWMAVTALFKQIKNDARNQALAFDLERSEYEKQALHARLRLLQAQVEPHFLFNTLANVRELVTTGSPQAPAVLDSLIAYLRAAVPRINQPTATLGQELDLVRAYLEVMHMRMPDRLAFALHAGDDTHALICPPMTLLTLVENAMRHGIDPSEEGGRIDVRVWIERGRCCADVIDTGVGLRHNAVRANDGLGTGLANLRERLQLAFGGDATLQLVENKPHGTRAEISFPAKVNDDD